jgi:hypothetical protein
MFLPLNSYFFKFAKANQCGIREELLCWVCYAIPCFTDSFGYKFSNSKKYSIIPIRDKQMTVEFFKNSGKATGTLPQNINGSSSFFKSPRISKV